MIRIVCRRDDAGMAAHVPDTAVKTTMHSFEVECPELEAWLADEGNYDGRSIVGIEVVQRQSDAGGDDAR